MSRRPLLRRRALPSTGSLLQIRDCLTENLGHSLPLASGEPLEIRASVGSFEHFDESPIHVVAHVAGEPPELLGIDQRTETVPVQAPIQIQLVQRPRTVVARAAR